MPLSEEELRLLEQMERALVAEDPKLASTMRGTRAHRRARRQMLGGALGFVAGLGLLMAGVVIPQIAVGILGFVVMLSSAYLALSAWRGDAGSPAGAAPAPGDGDGDAEQVLRVVQGGKRTRRTRQPRQPRQPKAQGSMMERFEERWRRRRDQGGYGRDY